MWLFVLVFFSDSPPLLIGNPFVFALNASWKSSSVVYAHDLFSA